MREGAVEGVSPLLTLPVWLNPCMTGHTLHAANFSVVASQRGWLGARFASVCVQGLSGSVSAVLAANINSGLSGALSGASAPPSTVGTPPESPGSSVKAPGH